MAQLIDGKVISAQIKDEVKEKVAGLKEHPGRCGSRIFRICPQQEKGLRICRYPVSGI